MWFKKLLANLSDEWKLTLARLVTNSRSVQEMLLFKASCASEHVLIYANTLALASVLPPAFFLCRNHHGAHHDNTQHHRQEVTAQSVLRDGHGPLRVRVLHLRVRSADWVWDAALLREQSQTEQKQRQKEEKPGEEIMHGQGFKQRLDKVLFKYFGLQIRIKFKISKIKRPLCSRYQL